MPLIIQEDKYSYSVDFILVEFAVCLKIGFLYSSGFRSAEVRSQKNTGKDFTWLEQPDQFNLRPVTHNRFDCRN
jgi:hypothetical protein